MRTWRLIPRGLLVSNVWLPSIQCLALALTRTPSLLEDPSLTILLTKNALRPGDRRRLSEVRMDELFDNVMYYVLKSLVCAYMAKDHNKILRQEFGTQRNEEL